MKKIFIIFVVTILFSCKSNYTRIGDKDANYIPYYLKTYEADSLYLTGNFEKSYKILDSLFKKYEPINQDAIYRIYEYEKFLKLKYILNKNIDKKEVIKLTRNFGYRVKTINNDTLLNKVKIRANITDQELEFFYKEYDKTKDYALRDTIYQMVRKDQRCRGFKGDYKDSIAVKNYYKKMSSTDSINRIKLKMLVQKYNGLPYPKYTGYNDYEIDNSKNVDLETLLLHQCTEHPEYERQFFLDLMINEVKKGRLQPFEYGLALDRRSKKIYNLYDFKKTNLFEKDSLKKLNKALKQIGIPNVEYQEYKRKFYE
jgi:hypothetical protein